MSNLDCYSSVIILQNYIKSVVIIISYLYIYYISNMHLLADFQTCDHSFAKTWDIWRRRMFVAVPSWTLEKMTSPIVVLPFVQPHQEVSPRSPPPHPPALSIHCQIRLTVCPVWYSFLPHAFAWIVIGHSCGKCTKEWFDSY